MLEWVNVKTVHPDQTLQLIVRVVYATLDFLVLTMEAALHVPVASTSQIWVMAIANTVHPSQTPQSGVPLQLPVHAKKGLLVSMERRALHVQKANTKTRQEVLVAKVVNPVRAL